MARVRLAFKGEKLTASVPRSFKQTNDVMARAVQGAVLDMASTILTRGRTDIQNGGNFGRRWVEGLKVDITSKGSTINMTSRITVSHNVSYFNIFQYGGVIHGKPLLWIPLGYTGIKIRARDWARTHGGLFYVKPKTGRPLLLSIRDKRPKFFGIESVRQKKRFHIIEIGNEVAAQSEAFYARRLASGGS